MEKAPEQIGGVVNLTKEEKLKLLNVQIRDRKTMSKLKTIALRRLQDEQQAEDAVQMALLKAFDKIDQFQGGNLGAWLNTIVSNAALDLLRKRKTDVLQKGIKPKKGEEEEQDLVTRLPGEASWRPDVQLEETNEESATKEMLKEAISQLPDSLRQIMEYTLQGKKVSEISKLMKLPSAEVKVRLSEAQERLREMLELEQAA